MLQEQLIIFEVFDMEKKVLIHRFPPQPLMNCSLPCACVSHSSYVLGNGLDIWNSIFVVLREQSTVLLGPETNLEELLPDGLLFRRL